MAIQIGTTYSKTGTRSGGSNSNNYAGIDYVLVSQDNINNTSKIRIRPWIARNSSSSGAYQGSQAELKVSADNQTQKKAKFTYDLRNTTTDKKYYLTTSNPFKRASGTSEPYDFTVKHSDDGTKTVNLYAYIPLYNEGTAGNYTVNINVELPKIPRGSVIDTISSYNVEENITLPITKYVDNYYDVLQIYNSDKTVLLATVDNVENGDTINLLTLLGADLLYTTMTTKFYKFVFVLNTYTSSAKTTVIGSNERETAGFLSGTTSSPLFVDFDIEDSNDTTYALTNNRSTFIKGYSTLKISNLNATGQKKATIAYWIVNDNAIANTGSNVIKIENYNTNSITVYAQDSRGMSTGLTKTITNFIEYFKLTKGNQNIERVDDVTEKVKISFEGDVWDGNFGAVSNTLQVTYQYKETKDSTWIDGTGTITPTIENNKYSFNGLILGDTNNGFNIGNSYDIKVTVKDKLSQVEFIYQTQSGKPAIALFGNKVAIGDKYNEELSQYDVQLYSNISLDGKALDDHIKNVIRDNQILWDVVTDADAEGWYMNGSQTANLSQNVSAQKSGIVLVWQAWSNSQPKDTDFNYTFIPKWHALNKTGKGVSCILSTSTGATLAVKYVYIHDNKIVGNNVNQSDEASRSSGITTSPRSWVLTKVIGV